MQAECDPQTYTTFAPEDKRGGDVEVLSGR